MTHNLSAHDKEAQTSAELDYVFSFKTSASLDTQPISCRLFALPLTLGPSLAFHSLALRIPVPVSMIDKFAPSDWSETRDQLYTTTG